MALLPAADVRAAEQRLRVLGSTSLEAQVTRPARNTLRLDGELTDDAGAPLPNARIDLTFPETPTAKARACEPAGGAPQKAPLALVTDGRGRFCAQLGEELAGAQLQLEYRDPAELLAASRLLVTAEAAPRGLELLLNVPPDLPLEVPRHTVEVAVLPRPTESAETLEAAAAPEEALAVELLLEAPHRASRPLGILHVRPGERGRAEVPRAELGDPGSAMLVARFGGSAAWAPAESRRQVSKTAHVSLEAPSALQFEFTRAPSEILVQARWRSGPVSSGTVEALLAERRIGASPVAQGQARLILALPEDVHEALVSTRGRTPPLELVYVPNAPWWRAGPPARVELSLAPPSPWSWLPWLSAAAAVLGWVALIWRRPAGRALPAQPTGEPPGRASLSFAEPGDGLGGQVFDAHTGAPLPDAVIEVLLPGVQELRLAATCRSGADGSFTLLMEESWEGLGPRIRIAAPGYSSLESPLSRKGRLLVHLVTARRAILERFLQWARRRGAPWSAPLPPTPAHIAALAESRREEPTALWARDIEAAVFGPEAPTEETERSLREREPAPGSAR